jgi:DNA-binding GntR family transcriptional regulator
MQRRRAELGDGEPVRLLPGELPRRQVLAEGVYETIKQLIMDQRLEPGRRISMDALARELDVSSTPVREALARLDADGLATKRPLAGYTVAPVLDAKSFADLFGMRMLLEPAAGRLAAARCRPGDADMLAEHMAAMRQVPSGHGYAVYREHAAHDARFHGSIAELSGNALLHETITRLGAHMHMYRLYFRSGFVQDTAREHSRILDALRAGDEQEAAEAMIAHIQASRERLASFV